MTYVDLPINYHFSTDMKFFPIAVLYFGLVVAFSTSAAAPETEADPLLAQAQLVEVASNMITALQDPAVRQNVDQIEQLVRRVLVPHIDFRASSNLVLGPHWKAASEAQRAAFINEFQAFLVRFYTGALASYVDSDEIPMDLMAFRDEPRSKGPRQVFVRSHVGQSDGDKVAVEFRMLWRGMWKVIDVSVDGISMVQSYRSNFSTTVKRQGLDALIAQLQERNQSFATN